MTLLITRDFDAGTAGASAAAEFSAVLGTAPVYHAPSAATGALGVRFVGSAGSSRGEMIVASSSTLWISFYLTIESVAPTNVYFALWRNGANNVGDLRMNTGTTTLTMRDNTSAISGTTTQALGIGTHRISIRSTPGSGTGHELRVYIGSNRDGTTPDFTATGAATAGGQAALTSVLLGVITSTTWSLGMDRLRIDNASEPAGYVFVPTPTAQTFQAATATGWTATGGTALAVLSDADDATYLTSSVSPSDLVLGPLVLRPIEAPEGDFTVTVRAQRVDASTASLVPTLRDSGGSVIATAATVNPGTSIGDLTVTFTAASISGVTQAQWRSGLLRVQLAATAAA